jgi:peptide chain release factor 1
MAEKQDNFIKKLEQLQQRYEEIDSLISSQEIASDATKLVPLTKEQGKLRQIVTKYREYKAIRAGVADAQSIIDDSSGDSEYKDLAYDEIKELHKKEESVLDQIKNTLVFSDDAVIDSVIVEIRPGTGGDEAALFASDLYGMYTRYAEKKRWKVELLEFQGSEMGGLKECIFNVKGPGVWSALGYEGGGHRVQRVPETESQGRIHTSAATVAVLPEPEEVDVDINPADVLEHVSCAGGPGGQNVNKVASAIKLDHVPTGITVSMRDENSQHKNRAKAWRILRTRVYDYYQAKIRAERDSVRKTMIGSGDRSQRIRTYNFPQNRVTDHRINVSLYSLDKFIMGDIDEMIAALQDHDKKQRLENL